jgi:hypothetical protein
MSHTRNTLGPLDAILDNFGKIVAAPSPSYHTPPAGVRRWAMDAKGTRHVAGYLHPSIATGAPARAEKLREGTEAAVRAYDERCRKLRAVPEAPTISLRTYKPWVRELVAGVVANAFVRERAKCLEMLDNADNGTVYNGAISCAVHINLDDVPAADRTAWVEVFDRNPVTFIDDEIYVQLAHDANGAIAPKAKVTVVTSKFEVALDAAARPAAAPRIETIATGKGGVAHFVVGA